MKRTLLFLVSVIMICCNNKDDDFVENVSEENLSSATFITIDANTENELTDMFFLNENQGVLSGAFGLFSKTNDGGETWIALDVGVNFSFLSAFMLDESKLFTGRVALYGSVDAGETFMEVGNLSNFSDSIFFIHYFDMNNAILNKGQVMLKTEDCGRNWEVTYNDGIALNRLQMVTSSTGFASGGATFDGLSEGRIIKTTDGGDSWIRLPYESAEIMAIYFESINVGYFVDFFGRVFKTQNGGDIWFQLAVVEGLPKGISFVNEEVGYIVTFQGSILETEDGGVTWESIYNEPGASFTNIEKFDGAIFAYGNEGLILKLVL